MEGLEVSVLMWREVLSSSYSQRLDSQYFRKEFLGDLYEGNFYYLSEICLIKSGTTPTDRDENLKQGVLLLKTDSIRNDVLSFTSPDDFFFIDEEINQRMKSTQLECSDVLMNIVGATTDVIGRCSLLSFDFPSANITQAIALLRIHSEFKTIFNQYYLFAFLSSKLGHKQVRRIARQTGQYNMNLQEVGSFKIPLVGISFQQVIKELIIKSEQLKIASQTAYSTAENLLLDALGLDAAAVANLNTPTGTVNANVKSFSSSFLSSGRLDAEYYQTKYDRIESIIKAYEGGFACLGNQLISIQTGEYSDGYETINGKNIPYIRNTNIKKGIIEDDVDRYVNPDDFKAFANQGDILTARVGAIGSFGLVNHEFAGSVYSDNVLCLTLNKSLLPDVYTLYFNSFPNQVLFEKISGGSVQPLITQTSIKDIVIPILEKELQIIVSKKLQESFILSKESQQLLDLAKRAVEVAIEAGEEQALALIGLQGY